MFLCTYIIQYVLQHILQTTKSRVEIEKHYHNKPALEMAKKKKS